MKAGLLYMSAFIVILYKQEGKVIDHLSKFMDISLTKKLNSPDEINTKSYTVLASSLQCCHEVFSHL